MCLTVILENVIEFFSYRLKQFKHLYQHIIIYIYDIHVIAVSPLLMLQTYRSEIIFTARFVVDGWEISEIEHTYIL